MDTNYQILFLVDSGIGNAIEALYAVEYCLHNNIKTGIFLNKVNNSFQQYLKECYGNEIILSSLENVKTKNLIHSFTYQETIKTNFENYFYIQPDFHSSQVMSETEQYLSVVRALYPSSYSSFILTKLIATETEKTKLLNIEKKIVIYPGGTSSNSARRWPYYNELISHLGENDVIVIGGKDDLNFHHSYIYPKFITTIFNQKILNLKSFWNLCKKIGFLIPHAHLKGIEKKPYSYFDSFTWSELVSIMKSCKKFVGNDGGLMHLAGASGANGIAIFGPTSLEKNKPNTPSISSYQKKDHCTPCQFGVGGVNMTTNYISCPFQVKCLHNIAPETILNLIND